MPVFDELVRLAERNSGVTRLRPVVEKELLHHEIVRALADGGMLRGLTFIGGTCLRACYGSNRLSEDLDFAGGRDFNADELRDLGATITKSIRAAYGLRVEVSEPRQEKGNVRTWKLRVRTRPDTKSLPQQRINIDVCAVESYEPRPTVLLNHYGVELGTSGLIVQVESKNEILADKTIALALRPNRVKHRDLWDIAWLVQRGETPDLELVARKRDERNIAPDELRRLLEDRLDELPSLENDFRAEMTRFLPKKILRTSVEQEGFWEYLTATIRRTVEPLINPTRQETPEFEM